MWEELGFGVANSVAGVLAEEILIRVALGFENFGHAVAEGFSTARPVIVSDQTAWTDIDPGITVDCLPLQTSAWLASAKRLLAMAPADCLAHSQSTHTRCLLDAHHLANQLSLFES